MPLSYRFGIAWWWRQRIASPPIPPQEFLGPSGPKLETELKTSSRGLPAPGVQKVKNGVEKESKKLKKSWNFHFFDSVFNCLDPGAGRPRELVFNSVPKGPRTPLGGLKGRKQRSYSGTNLLVDEEDEVSEEEISEEEEEEEEEEISEDRGGEQRGAGKSTLWTNTGQDRNFQRTLRAIGSYLFLGKFIWTARWSIPFPGEIRMDQWSWKFFKSFPLH